MVIFAESTHTATYYRQNPTVLANGSRIWEKSIVRYRTKRGKQKQGTHLRPTE